MVIESQVYQLPDGRCIRILSEASFQILDINGRHISYGRIEAVDYRKSLNEQYAKTRFVKQP